MKTRRGLQPTIVERIAGYNDSTLIELLLRLIKKLLI